MIVFVRAFLLESDATGCLMRLLRYPPVEDISELVSMAVRYKDYILGGCISAKPSLAAHPPPRSAAEPQPTPDSSGPLNTNPNPLNTPNSLSSERKPIPILIKDTRTLTTNEEQVNRSPTKTESTITSLEDLISML
jgi:hypothetical protein